MSLEYSESCGIICVSTGTYYTGWFTDKPFIVATDKSLCAMISQLWKLRRVFDEAVHDMNVDCLLDELKINHADTPHEPH